MQSKVVQTKKYDNLIMSWSSLGDFILVSESMKTMIEAGVIKRGIVISHQRDLMGVLSPNEKIDLLYPTQSFKDFLKLIPLTCRENIFFLHDMPSHNRFSKQIRLIMSIVLTKLRLSSKLLLVIDEQFQPDTTTKISKIFASKVVRFNKNLKIHISQYILNLFNEANITGPIKCKYNVELNDSKFDISPFKEYIILHPFASANDRSLTVEWCINFIKAFEKIENKKVLVIGYGTEQKNKIDEIVKNTTNSINMCGEVTFRQTLHLIKNCEAILNVDSGPAHYAASYKKPEILFWVKNHSQAYMPIHNPNAIFIFGNQTIKSKDVYTTADIKYEHYPDIQAVISAYKGLCAN